MTPAERIALVFGAIGGIHEPCGMPHGPDSGCTRDALVAHMEAMILEEREACALIVLGDTERDDFPWCGDVRDIAETIRDRSKQ